MGDAAQNRPSDVVREPLANRVGDSRSGEKNPRIKFIEGTDVTKLLFTAGDTPRVTGVEARKISDGSTSGIEADLVVDCSGRSSRAWNG